MGSTQQHFRRRPAGDRVRGARRAAVTRCRPFLACWPSCTAQEVAPPESRAERRRARQRLDPAALFEEPGEAAPELHEPLPDSLPLAADIASQIELIAVPAESPELIALAATLVSRLSTHGPRPCLLAVEPGSPSEDAVRAFVRRFAPEKALTLLPAGGYGVAGLLPETPGYLLNLPPGISPASMEIARRFWGTTPTAVFADAEPGPVIIGSALAAHRGLPLILLRRGYEARTLATARDVLSVQSGTLVTNRVQDELDWLPLSLVDLRHLTTRKATAELIHTIGARRVRNVVLSRAPGRTGAAGQTSWLAPYASLVRKAPLVLVKSADAARVESRVLRLMRSERVQPRTITILADEEAIGLRAVSIAPDGSRREGRAAEPDTEDDTTTWDTAFLEVEPFALPREGAALSFGVGRIPFPELPEASCFLARTFARKRLVGSRPTQVLMVGNPNASFGNLPFAETVSRGTAAEIKNLRLRLREFYGVASNAPEVTAAADESTLIIFEGHLYDQRIFARPGETENEAQGGYDEEDSWDREPHMLTPEAGFDAATVWLQSRQTRRHAEAGADGWIELPDGAADEVTQRAIAELVAAEEDGSLPQAQQLPLTSEPRELRGVPVVVLQSCQSLDPGVLYRLNDLGSVALVGTTTNVHSASGSTFAKALVDEVLYRDATLGEGLRDARNYFLCLQDLKNARAHRQQAKSHRVALSFRLWGDPELRAFTRKPPRPRRPQPQTQWHGPDQLHILMPGKRLPTTARTPQYRMRGYPGSRAAGIVKRSKVRDSRRILPMHFLRLDLPEGFSKAGFRSLLTAEGEEDRAVFRVDTVNRYLYVLYFPKKETPNATVVLRFSE